MLRVSGPDAGSEAMRSGSLQQGLRNGRTMRHRSCNDAVPLQCGLSDVTLKGGLNLTNQTRAARQAALPGACSAVLPPQEHQYYRSSAPTRSSAPIMLYDAVALNQTTRWAKSTQPHH